MMRSIRCLCVAACLVVASPWDSFGMGNYSDVLRDQYGAAIGGATVTIYETGTTTLASIYSDNGLSSKSNPFLTDAIDGRFNFYAANGVYDIIFSYPGATFDPAHTRRVSVVDGSDVGTTSGGGGGSGEPTGWPQVDAGDALFADAVENGVCVGVSNPFCQFEDSTLGAVGKTATDSNTRDYVWMNKTRSLFDVEANKDMWIVDPDAFATGSGTVTMQTSEQFVGSNLGIELSESDTNPTCSSGNYTIFADSSDATIKFCNNGSTVLLNTDTYIRKPSDETVNNTSTVQNDDSLVFSAAANTTYAVKLLVLYDSSTTADFKYNFSLPASATGWKATTSAPLATTSCSGTSATMVYNDITQTNGNVGGAGAGSSTICAMVIDATVVIAGTAGNVQFQWAQAAAEVSDTKVRANSWMSYRRIQ